MRYLKVTAQDRSFSYIDRNGVVDRRDQELVRHLCNVFLAFKWYEESCPVQ